jgi:hypothetical protein
VDANPALAMSSYGIHFNDARIGLAARASRKETKVDLSDGLEHNV